MSRRGVVRTVCAVAAAGILLGLWVWFFGADSAMEVAISLTPEGGKPFTTQTTVDFARAGREQPVQAIHINLGPWHGRLVRVSVTGALHARWGYDDPTGYVGCAAEMAGEGSARPLSFVGWRNLGRERVHPGTLGSPSFRGPRREGHTFVYARLGGLWTVLSVQPHQTLRLYLTPLLVSELPRRNRPYVPRAPKPWRAGWDASAAAGTRPPDVFIYLIDALRADHVGCYGYHRPTTPEIDDFARGAVVYAQAQTAATWTRSSVASLFTGLYPSAHGVMFMEKDKLDAWPVTIPEALQGAGYQTFHICTNGHASAHYGFTQGIDRFAYKNEASAEWVNRKASAFLQEADPTRPVFMYLHTVEPHAPYTPKAETLRLFDPTGRAARNPMLVPPGGRGRDHGPISADDVACLMDRYDAEIRDNDTAFGQFLALLKRTGRYENSLIILLADHGEAFGEHGAFMHGGTLTVEEMHVPLIVHYPGGRYAGRHVPTRVSLIDVYPTIMGVTGARPRLTYALAGRDLRPLAANPGQAPEVPIFSEVSMHENNRLDLVGVIDEDGYKRIFDMSVPSDDLTAPSSIGLWQVDSDPRERTDLAKQLPLRSAYDESLMANYLVTQRWWRGAASTGKPASAPMTPSMRKALRALGYLK